MFSTTALLKPSAQPGRERTNPSQASSPLPSSCGSASPDLVESLVWRHELKYALPSFARAAIVKDLRAFMDPDSLGDSEGAYDVRSLYFDSVDWRCFADKQAGLAVRHRLRIRGYIKSGSGPISGIKFEIKRRRDSRIAKVVAAVGDDYECLRPFFHGRPLPTDHPLAESPALRQFFDFKTIYSLSPVVNVQFRRQAFVARSDTTVRITLDDHLSARPARDLLEPWPGNPISMIGRDTILEIKVHRSLPFWVRRLIQKYHLQNASISKYCRSVVHCPFGLDASS